MSKNWKEWLSDYNRMKTEWYSDYNRMKRANIFAEHLRKYKQLTEKENKMETKEQILNKIKELQAIVDKMPDEPKGLWKPKTGDEVYSIDFTSISNMTSKHKFSNFYPWDRNIVSFGLYAKTKEQLETKMEALEVHQQLKEIAHELNNGVEIDWDNLCHNKHHLLFNFGSNIIKQNYEYGSKDANVVYCLSNKFMDIAIERIGKEKLERYLKEGF